MKRSEGYWRELVARALQVSEAVQQADVNQIWNYAPPSPGADEASILALEEAMGVPLDSEYKQLLSVVNGWDSFYNDVDLLGTDDFPSGARVERAWTIVDAVNDGSQGILEYNRDSFIPIAVSAFDIDVFLLELSNGGEAGGRVSWVAGQEIERFESVSGFFEAMVQYNEATLVDLIRDPWLGAGGKSSE